MASITVNPRTRLSKVPVARTYSGVASRYADTFAKAVDQQEQNEIATNLSEFKLGNISYDTFKSYLQGKIDGASVGSKNRADWTNIMVDAEKYNKTNIENDAKATVEMYRTEAIDKFNGAMGTKDELALVQSLKNKVDAGTGAYADLVAEEQNLKQKLASERKTSGSKNLATNLDLYFADIENQNKKIQEDYKAGRITGMDADSRLYQNGLDMTEAIGKAIDAGISVPNSILSSANEATNKIQERLALRQVGQVFDVFDKSGNLLPVTHQDILNDANSSSPQLISSKYEPVVTDAETGTWGLRDTTTGQNLPDVMAMSKDEALKLARNMPDNQLSVSAPGMEPGTGLIRVKQYSIDPNTAIFSSTDAQGNQIQSYSPVPGRESVFKVQPKTNIGEFIQTGMEMLGSFRDTATNKIGDFLGLQNATQTSPLLQEPVTQKPEKLYSEKPTVGLPGNPFASPLAKTNKTQASPQAAFSSNPFITPGSQPSSNNMSPVSNNQSIKAPSMTPFSLNMSGPQLSPEKLYGSSANRSSSQTGAFTTSPMTSSPTVTGGNLVDKIKNWGVSALGAIKGLFS